ncbi:JAB domain-containing protein [Sphingopyxis fribergensis]
MADLLEPLAGRASDAAADRLIRHFGGLGRALSATPEQLGHALPDHPEVVRAILAARALFETALRERVSRSKVGIADPDYRKYLRMQIGSSATECLHATFVTADWDYLGDERMANGSPGKVDSNLRGLLTRAFDLGAQGIVLAHNHPSGSSEPSAADIALTRRIAGFTRSVDVLLLDHLIVGADAIVSMKERGLM